MQLELLTLCSLKPKNWIISLQKKFYKRKKEWQTIHNLICKIQLTLIYKFLFTVLYTFQANLVYEFCAHIDLKWSCEQYDLLPLFFDFQKMVVVWGQAGEKIKYYWSGKILQVCKEQKRKVGEFCLLKRPGHYGLLTNNEYTWMPLL